MTLKTLLVSKDDQAAETLTHVLANFGMAVDRSSAAEIAVSRFSEEHFDQVIVDFEDAAAATLVLEASRRQTEADHSNPAITVALLNDASQIRSVLGKNAHFILIKPISEEQASTTLRAATALLKRERRQAFRVAVQAPVSIHTEDAPNLEGILLDLSAGGMDVLAAKPLTPNTLVHASFELPDNAGAIEADAEVAWTSANGQTGLRFLDIEVPVRDKLGEWLTAHAQEALPEEPDPVSQCQLTDLSLGGCYVETESPFPQSSVVDLCLKAAGMEIHTEGFVRVMHPGHGMGIEFPARTEEQRKSVGDFIEFLTSQPDTKPQLEISPRSLAASAKEHGPDAEAGPQMDDPLLELLVSGQLMEESEFLAALHQQRRSAEVGN